MTAKTPSSSMTCLHRHSFAFTGAHRELRRGRVGGKSEQRSQHYDEYSHPDPHYQRVDPRFDDGPFGIGILACIYKVEIFARGAMVRHHSFSSLAGFVEATFRIHGRDLASILEDVNDGRFARVIRIIFLGVRPAAERVRADGHLV